MYLKEWLLFSIAVFFAQGSLAWSPSNSYTPANVSCDEDINLIRQASGPSTDETDWLEKRDVYTREALRSFLDRATSNFSDSSLVSQLFSNASDIPRIAVACSGGGYRAMLSGAGMLAAMDNRTDGANEHGLGGLLQSTTYLAGLSGGNWLVGTLAWNNWTSVQDIVNNMTADDSIWDISNSIINPGGFKIVTTIKRWDHISDAVEGKQDAGFNVSLTDIWGRALSYNFFPSLYRGGVAYTWSTLRDVEVFQNGEMPFPISVADGRYPGTQIIDLNATVFEFNPFEMGSWDPTVNAFTDVKYLGTKVSNGEPVNKGQCVAGYDNTGFIMGTSSSLFNQFLLQINSTSLPSFIKTLVTGFLGDLSEDEDDIAIYAPNPFKDTSYIHDNFSKSISESDYLYLVDGGEDNQNIPLLPLVQDERNIDVIFALDNSADTDDYWPDGASLVATYERQFSAQGVNMSFPYVPDKRTFMNLGLADKPSFFGCDAQNLTDLNYIPPLVVYIPNAKHSYNSNTSTFKLSYTDDERLKMIKNGFEATTRGNLTDDSSFMGCVACAVMRRKQQSLNATLPEECSTCFTNYCWNGTIDDSPVSGLDNSDFDPTAASSAYSAYNTDSYSSASATDSKKNGAGLPATPTSLNTLLTLLTAIAGFL